MVNYDYVKMFEKAHLMAIGICRKAPHQIDDVAGACYEEGVLQLNNKTWKDHKLDIQKDMVNAGRRYLYKESNQEGDVDLQEIDSIFADSYTGMDQHKTLELREHIDQMVSLLNDEQKEIFFYYYGLGLDQTQTAEMMDMSQQTISRRISCINVTLKRYGQKNELFSEKIFEV